MPNNKLIWITGASSGIGRSISIAYSALGYDVILSARNKQNLEKVKEDLEPSTKSYIVPFDVTDFEAANKSIYDILNNIGCPDIIILNAGISQRSLAIDTNIDVTTKLMITNFLSNVNITKQMLPSIIKHKAQIGVISSVTGKIGPSHRSSYAASKHALHGYFDSLRAELQGTGVTITLICPGYVQTDISLNALTGDGTAQKSMDKDTAQGLDPMDLAHKIVKAMKNKKSEVYFGGKEVYGIYLKRYFPSILEKLLIRSKPE